MVILKKNCNLVRNFESIVGDQVSITGTLCGDFGGSLRRVVDQ
jgi:hypothetical protein